MEDLEFNKMVDMMFPKKETETEIPSHGYKSDHIYNGIMELKKTLIFKGLLKSRKSSPKPQ